MRAARDTGLARPDASARFIAGQSKELLTCIIDPSHTNILSIEAQYSFHLSLHRFLSGAEPLTGHSCRTNDLPHEPDRGPCNVPSPAIHIRCSLHTHQLDSNHDAQQIRLKSPSTHLCHLLLRILFTCLDSMVTTLSTPPRVERDPSC